MISSVKASYHSNQYLPESANILGSNYDAYTALPFPNTEQSSVEIIPADARSLLIENFFQHYHSPMRGLGAQIVSTADKYNLPFGILPAIAQCEGNLGKVMPADSFNTWGFGIYGDKITRFKSWNEGIEKVSKGLRKDYFDKGLTTPTQIMKKYTPSSNGSWANCVGQFLQELR